MGVRLARPLSLPTLAVAGLLASPLLANELPVSVSVYAEHQGANVVYRYEVRNNGPGELREFYIGCDCAAAEAQRTAQLRVVPAGATPGAGAANIVLMDIPLDATSQPAGWRVELARSSDASNHWLMWRMPAARSKAGVLPGQTLAGFSITLPQADPAYLQGRYSAHVLHNGRYVQITGPLTLLDTAPPVLSLRPSFEGQNGVAATFRVVATATDDRDPAPEIKLESVERAHDPARPEEQRYIIGYSATDASGNRTVARTTVRLPPPAPADRPVPGLVQASLAYLKARGVGRL
jgi:hypothetical protein